MTFNRGDLLRSVAHNAAYDIGRYVVLLLVGYLLLPVAKAALARTGLSADAITFAALSAVLAFLFVTVFALDFWRMSKARAAAQLANYSRGTEAATDSAASAAVVVDVVADARRRQVRAQLGGFLRHLYHGAGSSAMGELMHLCQHAIALLRMPPSDPVRYLASNLLSHQQLQFHAMLQPLLDAQQCDTDEELRRFLEAWGKLFEEYQALAFSVDAAFRALAVDVSADQLYQRWLNNDGRVIEGLRRAEHMEGAEALVPLLRRAGWGDDNRQRADGKPA